jgi:hypothetical protein
MATGDDVDDEYRFPLDDIGTDELLPEQSHPGEL